MTTQATPIVYRDIDLSMSRHPVTGDVSAVTNDTAVVQSIYNLVNASVTEFLWQPEIGGNVGRLLFQINDPLFRYNITSTITETIKQHEPRATLQSVNVTSIQNNKGVNVRILFYILNIEDPIDVTFKLLRTR